MTHYNTIEQEGFAEYKERGSKFLAYSFPFNDAQKLKTIIQNLKKEHPKAVHFCFAYKIGIDGNKFRSSDDGEPSGSAGKPILGQIESKGLTDVLIVVVRYFGGTLLGVPGLISAYKSAASMSLQVIPVIRKPILAYLKIDVDFTKMNEILAILKKYNCQIIDRENSLFSSLSVGIPLEMKEEALYNLSQIQNINLY